MNLVEIKRWLAVFTPSLSSGFICTLIGIFMAGTAFLSASFIGSYESIAINNAQLGEVSNNAFLTWYQNVYWNVLTSDKLGSIPLFLFWCAIGAISYFTVAGIIEGVRDLKEIQDETEYVHINRKSLLREQGEKLIIRLIALALLFVLLQFIIGHVLPWSKTLAQVGANESGILQKIEYAASAVTITAFSLHFCVVLFRLIALRVRLFSSVLPEEA